MSSPVGLRVCRKPRSLPPWSRGLYLQRVLIQSQPQRTLVLPALAQLCSWQGCASLALELGHGNDLTRASPRTHSR